MSSFSHFVQNQFPLLPYSYSNYFSISEFHEELKSYNPFHELSLFHINIRSLNANNHKLFQLINSFQVNFDLIILSEIWAYNIENYANLFPDYKFLYSLPIDSKVGGVGAFIKKSWKVKQISIYDKFSPSVFFEAMLFEMSNAECKYLIGCLYRHPSPLSQNSYRS